MVIIIFRLYTANISFFFVHTAEKSSATRRFICFIDFMFIFPPHTDM